LKRERGRRGGNEWPAEIHLRFNLPYLLSYTHTHTITVKYVQNIEHDILVEPVPSDVVDNPRNIFQNSPLGYLSELTVDYWKGGYLDTPLL
jgi:hypothetical protein